MTNAKAKASGISLPFLSLSVVLLSWTSFHAGKVTREYIDLAHNVSYSRENLEAVESRAHDLAYEGLWTTSEREILLSVTSEYDKEAGGDENYEHEDVSLLSFRQLFLDLDGIAAHWIQSDKVLQERMKEIAKEYDSHLIAQGCHQDTSGFITCLGTFEDAGHIAIHAWPQRGVVLFDMLAGDSKLIDNVEAFCDIFHADMPMVFDPFLSMEDPRGPPTWHTLSRASVQCSSDYEAEIGTNGESKFMVASLKTGFQQVDVVDIQILRDRVDLNEFQQKDPAYIKAHPEFFQPDRLLFLDGVVQSTLCGDAPYHEALVQPSMFAHPNPKRVAIIGGGEGATLREVLKHNTVEKVVMIEIDPGVIEVSKAYLPSWNDCSNYEGSNRYCMDDPRAEIHTEDALKWFIDRYLGMDGTNKEAPLFDVIIMDALDPQDVVQFAKALYGDSSFLGALYAALSENGILITQVGDAPGRGDAPEHLGDDGNRVVYATSLATIGFKSIVDYSEDHTGFEEPWYFYAAFKDLSTRGQWTATEAEINLKMQKRSIHTVDGRSPFVYFDGATMNAYRYPSQASVDVFCLREPTPPGCKDQVHGFDPNVKNFRADQFNVTTTNTGARDGRGIVAIVDVPLNSFLTLEQTVYPIIIEPSAGELIERMSYHAIGDEHNLGKVRAFARGYGDHCRRFEDFFTTLVQTGIMAFASHECIALSNVGMFQNNTDNGVDSNCMLDEFGYYRNQGNGTVFNPTIMRDTTSRVEHTNIWSNIIAGEEILKHYCPKFSGAMEWASLVRALRGHCLGGVLGKVEQYREEGSIQDDDEETLSGATFSHYQSILEISSTGPIAEA